MPSTLREVLEELRESALDQRDKGDKFERLTGTTACPEPSWSNELASAGSRFGALTRSSKVLVAAHPDSQSGKATETRRFGISIVTEPAMLSALNEMT